MSTACCCSWTAPGLGSALTSPESDLTLADLAALTDVFTIGGTKNGALFGEAVVLTVPCPHFRWHIKQRGGMLAKGRLLGVQFQALLKDDLYFDIGRHANVCLPSAGRLQGAGL